MFHFKVEIHLMYKIPFIKISLTPKSTVKIYTDRTVKCFCALPELKFWYFWR